jgi:hypothetical protein
MNRILYYLIISIFLTTEYAVAEDVPKSLPEAPSNDLRDQFLRADVSKSAEVSSRIASADETFMAAWYFLAYRQKNAIARERAIQVFKEQPDLLERLDAVILPKEKETFETYLNRTRLLQALTHIKQRRVVQYLITLVDRMEAPDLKFSGDVAGGGALGLFAARTLGDMQLPDSPKQYSWPTIQELPATKAAWQAWFEIHKNELEE